MCVCICTCRCVCACLCTCARPQSARFNSKQPGTKKGIKKKSIVPTKRKYTVTSSGWRGPPMSSIKYLAASKCCTAARGLAGGTHDGKYGRLRLDRVGKVR